MNHMMNTHVYGRSGDPIELKLESWLKVMNVESGWVICGQTATSGVTDSYENRSCVLIIHVNIAFRYECVAWCVAFRFRV